ncbi:copper resistance CopC/CopD family protein [Xylanibacillus composti]|uniref:Copper transport protein n=1 Tax=Xylanibacillus composti TaxID=1572762 RepID=A0A8J4H1U9_9BACL|nr:copper resistance protein CopC [Xylanibacillus composti]GIQ67872.1 hypothetical protein XYCOK13_06960 [Xylanibacillus composti]
MERAKLNQQSGGKEERSRRLETKRMSGATRRTLPGMRVSAAVREANGQEKGSEQKLQNKEGNRETTITHHETRQNRQRSQIVFLRSRLRRRGGMSLWLVGLLLCCLYWGAASPVSGHAYVTASNPEPGKRLEQMPTEVSLTFNERVDNSLFELTVLDQHGRNVAADPELDSKRVTLRAELTTDADGLYTVNYRVISLDGHPVGGTYVFAAGLEARDGEDAELEASGEQAHDSSSSAAHSENGSLSAVRGGYLAALLLLTGSVWWRRQDMAVPLRPQLLTAIVLVLYAGMFGQQYGAWLLSQGVTELAAFAVSSAGWPWTLQLLLLAAGLWLSAAGRTIALVWAGALLAVESVQGHAARGPAGMGFLADFVHLGAAALWTAGLAGLLWTLLRKRQQWRERASKFSRTAVWSMVLLVLSGLVQGVFIWGGRWDELVYTAWGQLAVLKVLLTAAVVLTASAIWLLLRKRWRPTAIGAFAIDLLLMCLLIGTAAVMSFRTPAPVSEPLHWHTMADRVHVEMHMEPKRLGENRIALSIWADSEVPLPEQVGLVLIHLDREELQPLELELQRLEVEESEEEEEASASVHTHQYKVEEALIPMVGRWEAVLTWTGEEGEPETLRQPFRVFSGK